MTKSNDDTFEIEITPAMVAAGMEAVRAAWDNGDYLDEEGTRVFTAMLAACESVKFHIRVSDEVHYKAQ